MARKLRITLIVIIVLVGIIGLALTLNTNLLDRIDKAGSLISAFASVITLVLALLLFNKYGIEQNVLEKNIDRIEKLTEEIRKISLQFEANHHWFQLLPLQNEFYKALDEHSKKIKKFRVLVNLDYANNLSSILSFATDPFIPQEIAQRIKKLDLMFGVSTKGEKSSELSDTVKVSVSPTVKIGEQAQKDYVFFNTFHPQDKTIALVDYINLWRDLSKSIQSWMNRHSNTKTDINIDVR